MTSARAALTSAVGAPLGIIDPTGDSGDASTPGWTAGCTGCATAGCTGVTAGAGPETGTSLPPLIAPSLRPCAASRDRSERQEERVPAARREPARARDDLARPADDEDTAAGQDGT